MDSCNSISGDNEYYKFLWEEVDKHRKSLVQTVMECEKVMERKDEIIRELLKILLVPELRLDDYHYAIIQKAQQEVS